jgi:hypothetical protein
MAICQPGYLKDRNEDDDGDSGDKYIPAGQDSGSELEPTNDVSAQQHACTYTERKKTFRVC